MSFGDPISWPTSIFARFQVSRKWLDDDWSKNLATAFDWLESDDLKCANWNAAGQLWQSHAVAVWQK
jgi:hypothetical protein